MPIPIASADDPRLAPYRDLKDNQRAREGGFLVEGVIALERLLSASLYPVRSILLSEHRAQTLAPLLTQAPAGTPVFVAPQAVLDTTAGLHLHRGVLALADRTAPRDPAQLLKPDPLLALALIGLSNADNVGACFRNAAAFGANAMLLDETCCDPLYRKAIRVSSGHALSLPFAQAGDGDHLLDVLHAADVETWALTPAGGDPVHALTPPPRLALLLGAEGPGLPPSLMDRTRRVSIPMASNVDSLNVATAAAVALAHVFASRNR